MKKKLLTQKQAWLYISRAFAAQQDTFDRRFDLSRWNITCLGLCNAARRLYQYEVVSCTVYSRMANKLRVIGEAHFPGRGYWVSRARGRASADRKRAHWAKLFATRPMSVLMSRPSLWR
jgi:hypothetical protein